MEKQPLQTYSPAMKSLMLAIGRRMGGDPEKWITGTWISQDSSLYDFGLSDQDHEDILRECKIRSVRGLNLGKLSDAIKELPLPLVFGKE